MGNVCACCSQVDYAEEDDDERAPLVPRSTHVLVVTLRKATTLIPRHGDTCNAFVEFTLQSSDPSKDSQVLQSSVVKKTLNPVWDPPETFEFVVSDVTKENLIISVYDAKKRRRASTAGIGILSGDEPEQEEGPEGDDEDDHGAVIAALDANSDSVLGDSLCAIKTIGHGSVSRTFALVNPVDTGMLQSRVVLSLEILERTDHSAAITDVLYENQRWQPTLMWGSSFPGHLYPSDVGKWSDETGENSSQEFDDVAPELPDGWVAPNGWEQSYDEGDEDGWSYAVTFGTTWHPEKDEDLTFYVRRRKWVRTRRRKACTYRAGAVPSYS